MVVVDLVLVAFIFELLEFSAASQPLAVRRPLLFSRNSPVRPNVPARRDVPSAPLSIRNVQHRASELSVRGIVGIEHLDYTQTSYNVLMTVGNIPFEVALDTGSSDFWLISDGCTTPQCKGLPAYPFKTYASPTFSSVNGNQTAFNLSFADGTGASGFVAREKVQINGVQTEGQAFGLAMSSNISLGTSTSGLLGLGFPRLSRISASTPNAPPFLSALAELGQLSYPLFGLSLTRNTSGTLSMGAIDSSIVPNISLISWHDVVPFAPFPGENVTSTSIYLNWALPLNNLTVNGTSINLKPTFPNITGPAPLALLDVGNNGIYGPFQDVATIFTTMGTVRQVTEGTWALPCNIKSTMTFSFAGTNITLQPSDFLIGPTLGDPNLCLSWPMALPPSPDGLDWRLGTPFLRTVYSIYSYGISGHEAPLIGLYPLSNATVLTDTPESLSSIFSSLSATVSTTAPAVLLPTPSYTTPAYIFNTSASPLPTSSQSDLGASTYSPLFTKGTGLPFLANTSALPVVNPPTTLATLIMTDASGSVHTTTSSSSPIPTASLGKAPDSKNGATTMRHGNVWTAVGVLWIWIGLSGVMKWIGILT